MYEHATLISIIEAVNIQSVVDNMTHNDNVVWRSVV